LGIRDSAPAAAMIVLAGRPLEVRSLCECCREQMIQSTVWAQHGRSREAVVAGQVTILRAADKVVELYAGDRSLGVMPTSDRTPTLASSAAHLKGRWVLLRREVMVRLDAITYWRAESGGGAHVLVDGVAIQASRRCWLQVKRILDA